MGRERGRSLMGNRCEGCVCPCRGAETRSNSWRSGKDRGHKKNLVRGPRRLRDPRSSSTRYDRDSGPDKSSRGKFRYKGSTTITIFIDNIHRGVSEYQLGRLIRRFACWSRLFISRKWRLWNQNACAFVDVCHVDDAKKVIDGIKGWNINGSSLWARMEYQGHKAKVSRDTFDSTSPQHNRSTTQTQKEYSNAKSRLSIKVNADAGMKACLSRCVVVTIQEDKNPKETMEFLHSRWPNLSGLLALSRRKFLMLFNSNQEAKEVVNQSQTIGEGLKIRPWDWKDQVEKRRTWVVLRGIPLHAWNKTNMRKIAQLVRDVIKIEEEENHFVENAEIRIHIETSTLQMINWKIAVTVEGQSFPVSIVEGGNVRTSCSNIDPSESIVQFPDELGVHKRVKQNSLNTAPPQKHGRKEFSCQDTSPSSTSHPRVNEDHEPQGDSILGDGHSVADCSTQLLVGQSSVPKQCDGVVSPRENETEREAKTDSFQVQEATPDVGQCEKENLAQMDLRDAGTFPQHQVPADKNNIMTQDDHDQTRVSEDVRNNEDQVDEEEGEDINIPKTFFQEADPFINSPPPSQPDKDVIKGVPARVEKENNINPEKVTNTPPKNQPSSPTAARDERGKIINPEAEADECIKLLLQLGCQVPNPIQTKANIVSQIQEQWI